ncbi:hypothetical protein MMC10_007793 [Thelotrema lepadinum]|nr:hypothetical protein [Thelotrema lepadinum]
MIRVIDTAKDKFDDTMLSCSQGLDASPNSTQEASMTANLNRIFGDARERPPAYKPMCLTGQLAALYEQPGLIQLHQRLEASLRFGALALPKGESPAARLQTDVAVRGQFLDLWTTAYKHSVLNAAIQAISRHGTADQRSPPSSEAHVRAHLESFLLNHEEAVQGHERKGALLATSSWERTMGKSLMIILLLDWARQAGFVGVPVFNQNSPFKSSWAVLLKLDSLVRPSWTNMKRTLAHLGYRLDHTQHSLAEFDFTIQNLAVDLRDGVRLTRLVELLLSDSSVGSASKNRPNLGQTTRLRIGKIEDMASPQTLTKALKYPLSGKAAKLHNVQIALDAMKEAACNPAFSEGITATDIVEGHREKTILLLRYLLHDKALSSFTDRPNLIDGGVLSKPQVDSNPDHISTKVPLLLKIQSGNVLPELQATLGGEKTWF